LKEPFPFVFGLFVVEFVTAVSGFEIGGLVEVWFIFFFDFMNFWSSPSVFSFLQSPFLLSHFWFLSIPAHEHWHRRLFLFLIEPKDEKRKRDISYSIPASSRLVLCETYKSPTAFRESSHYFLSLCLSNSVTMLCKL
jgi:hypothetical protein